MVCFFVRRLIQAYLGDALSEGDARHLHHHCEVCASCHAALREAQATARLIASFPRHSLPDDEKERLLARIRTRAQEQLGEQLLGTSVSPPLPRKPLSARVGDAWDAARHSMTVAGFRILRSRAALSTCAAVPVAAMLLILLHRGVPTPETVATLGTGGVEQRAADTSRSSPDGLKTPGVAGAPSAPGRSLERRPAPPGAPPALREGPRRAPSGAGRTPGETGPRTASAPTRARRTESLARAGATGSAMPGAPLRDRTASGHPKTAVSDASSPAPAAQARPPQAAEVPGHAQPQPAAAPPEKAVPVEVARATRAAAPPRLQPEGLGGGLLDQASPDRGATPPSGEPGGVADSAPGASLPGVPPERREAAQKGPTLPAPPSPRGGSLGSPPGGGAAAPAPAPAPGEAGAAPPMASPPGPSGKGRFAGRSVEELVRLLKGKPDEARAAAEELGRTRAKRAVGALATALREHPDPGVKAAAARALAAIGDAEALAALRAAAAGNTPASEPARRALEAIPSPGSESAGPR